MNADTVTQILTNQGVPRSVIVKLIDAAMKFQSAQSSLYRYRVINTNAGMPAEFRIERI